MTTRRTGILTALVLTAVLFGSMPGLLRTALTHDPNRMAQVLRPPRLRTLTVWKLGSSCGDGTLIARACTAFEKQHRGVRVFLRTADAQEVADPQAVLPDLVLFETGSMNMPDKVFVPLLDEQEPSGTLAGVCYAVPLWLAPNVLSLPLGQTEADWERLVQPGALKLPEGVALQQLLCMCPQPLRASLIRQTEPPVKDAAQVRTLDGHMKAAQSEEITAVLLTPAVSDRVRYAALCRDGEDARAFLRFLRSDFAGEAPALGLIPVSCEAQAQEEIVQKAIGLFAGVKTLPNAFAHLKDELKALCRDAFLRGTDPVETLLKLR